MKIFTDRGFFSDEGKVFVNDHFTKNVTKMLQTASNPNDVDIICSLLKSVVGAQGSDLKHAMSTVVEPTEQPLKIKVEKPLSLTESLNRLHGVDHLS